MCPSNFSWRRRGRGVVEVRYIIYFVRPLRYFGGVVEVEVCPVILVGGGGVEVRKCRYLLGPVPHFGGVVEVDVNPSNLVGGGGVEVRYSIYFV